jgi:hypothetical protein
MASKSSGEQINYTLRPKKQIERKILINSLKEIFSELSLSKEIHKYRYVGMGSIYYYDFILFYRYLHIQKMTSLDKHWTKKRFEFNRPYDFIEFKSQYASEFVNSYNFKEPLIAWFDYDYMLYQRRPNSTIVDTGILQDMQLLQNKLKKNDVFIVTVNVRYPGNHNKKGKEELEWIYNEYRQFLPKEIKSFNDISEQNYGQVIQQVIINCLNENQKFKKIKVKKILSFLYSDGVPMYTFGGIAYENEDEINALRVPYVNTSNDYITVIEVPNLTVKEKIYLDSKIVELQKQVSTLTAKDDKNKKLANAEFEFNFQDLDNYIKYHKYYPQYFESLL